MSTGLLVSTGASMVNLLSNVGTWNQASRDPKTQPSHKQCVLVHCLAGRHNSQAIPTENAIALHSFLWLQL